MNDLNRVEWQRDWDIVIAFAAMGGGVTAVYLVGIWISSLVIGPLEKQRVRAFRFGLAAAWPIIFVVTCVFILFLMMLFGG